MMQKDHEEFSCSRGIIYGRCALLHIYKEMVRSGRIRCKGTLNAGSTIQASFFIYYTMFASEFNFQNTAISSISATVSGSSSGQVCRSEVMEVVLNCWSRGGYGLLLHRNSPSCGSEQSALIICYIEKGSPADRSEVLQVGDRVLAINDYTTNAGTSDEANNLLKRLNGAVVLVVEFDVIESVLPNSGIFTVKLAKRKQNLGVIISSNTSGHKGEPVVVSDVRIGSVAHRCGSIFPGDQLISIDNIPLDTCTVEEAVRLLQRSSDIVKLRVKKNSSLEEDGSFGQTVVYSIELNRKGGQLGITIAGTDERNTPIFISQLALGGLAEKTGALHVGDRLLAINGHSLKGKRVSEAIELLQQSADIITLKVAHFVFDHPRFCYYVPIGSEALSHHLLECGYKYENVSDKLCTPVQSVDSAVESLDESPMLDLRQILPTQVNKEPLLSFVAVPPSTFMVELHKDKMHSDFGFSISDSLDHKGVYINNIRPAGPASKCGNVCPYDHILQGLNGAVVLVMEFDVIGTVKHLFSPFFFRKNVLESVLPNSSIFTVKLAERKQNLGVIISSNTSGHKGEPVVVSDVRIGSVAHRCGSIFPGDQLISIDNIPLDTCTVEEAVRLLQRSSDIVNKKEQLNRKGGQLGITVGGTDERKTPIFISLLALSGLVEKTGALYVGDRLLAINGHSLGGERVSEAIELFQQCADIITLKVILLNVALFSCKREIVSNVEVT
uniref:Glutamate receptor-interacting protein 2 n=1 Tax=Soboliphyme baturini TaxID=241478 RepID=A0A183IV53_9BILA